MLSRPRVSAQAPQMHLYRSPGVPAWSAAHAGDPFEHDPFMRDFYVAYVHSYPEQGIIEGRLAPRDAQGRDLWEGYKTVFAIFQLREGADENRFRAKYWQYWNNWPALVQACTNDWNDWKHEIARAKQQEEAEKYFAYLATQQAIGQPGPSASARALIPAVPVQTPTQRPRAPPRPFVSDACMGSRYDAYYGDPSEGIPAGRDDYLHPARWSGYKTVFAVFELRWASSPASFRSACSAH